MNTDRLRRAGDPTDLPAVTDQDDTRFAQLLAMAGPAHRDELLSRLLVDLAQVRDTLATALVPPDWAALRAQTHILVALAGACGAVDLQHRAEALNRMAHAAHRPDPGAGGAAILDGIDRLISHVRTHAEGHAG
jgi:hypothetical protein